MTLSFQQMNRPDSAFAAAIVFLAARAPFQTMPFGSLADTVSGAVKRRHYLFAVEAGTIVGLTCWALTSAEVAERWMAGEMTPTYEETVEGDTVVLTLGGGEHPQVALQGVRKIASFYPGRPYWMNRFGRAKKKHGRFPVFART